MTFAEKLKMIRRQKGFSSQQSLGMRSGISTYAISRIESGHNFPSLESLMKLSRVLGMTLDEIMEGVDI